ASRFAALTGVPLIRPILNVGSIRFVTTQLAEDSSVTPFVRSRFSHVAASCASNTLHQPRSTNPSPEFPHISCQNVRPCRSRRHWTPLPDLWSPELTSTRI